jgi:fatty acid-binding protein DegV
VRDSQVVPLERVRTRSKALERIGQIISELGPLDALGIAQSDTGIGQELQKVARTLWSGPIEMFSLGPVVGTHAGPGAGAIIAVCSEHG